MKSVEEIRLEKVRFLIKQEGGNEKFAKKIDRSATQVSRLAGKNPKTKIGPNLARHIEACFSKEEYWLDHVRQDALDSALVSTKSSLISLSEKCISLSDSLFLFRGTENFKTTRENSCYLLAKCSDSDLKSGQLVFARDDMQQVRLFEVLQPEFTERTIFVSVDDGEFTTFQLSEQTELIGVLLDELDFI